MMGDREAAVLRATGCSTVIVRENLIAREGCTGKKSSVYLIDGKVKLLPEARISIESPFHSEEVVAKVMDALLCSVIIGNISVGDPDLN